MVADLEILKERTMIEYAEDDFGEARIIRRQNDEINPLTCYGTIEIIQLQKKKVVFKDNDGYLYMVAMEDFQFTKKERNEYKPKNK